MISTFLLLPRPPPMEKNIPGSGTGMRTGACVCVCAYSGSVEYLGKHRAEGGKIYDPRYALPMIYYLLHAMTEQNSVAKKGGGREHVLEISLNRWMHSGVLGYILRALGAVDHTLRELGYGCMTLFAALMKGSKHTQVRQCPCLKHPHEPLWRGVSVSGNHSHFSVGGCGELIFAKGTVGKIVDLRKNGENGTVKNGYFVPIFLPLSSIASRHNPSRPTSRVL